MLGIEPRAIGSKWNITNYFAMLPSAAHLLLIKQALSTEVSLRKHNLMIQSFKWEYEMLSAKGMRESVLKILTENWFLLGRTYQKLSAMVICAQLFPSQFSITLLESESTGSKAKDL